MAKRWAGSRGDALTWEYEIHDGELRIRDTQSGRIVWQGRPLGLTVWKLVRLPETDDVVVLLHWPVEHTEGACENVARLRPDGSVVWRARVLPSERDRYSGIWINEGRLFAYGAMSGYDVELDPMTGNILSKTWAK